MPIRRRSTALTALGSLLGLALLLSCAGPKPAANEAKARSRPVVVLGIDGASWKVIEALWQEGRLPHFRELAQRGVRAPLRTHYNSSPVIWTTIATGLKPEEHGITDFVVPTASGDVPVSSSVRRAPALWNMLTRAHRRVAVLGWWASWPAEAVSGVVVSDRAERAGLPHRVSPPELVETLDRELEKARRGPNPFDSNSGARLRDLVMTRLGSRMAREGYDLTLVYLRGVDIVSHQAWKYWQPEAFPDLDLDPEEAERLREAVPREYEAADLALGQLLEAAGGEADVFVISDHGFRAAPKEIVRVFLDFDLLLEQLGFLERRPDASVDLSASRFYAYSSPDFRRAKLVRFCLAGREPGGRVDPEDRESLRRKLEAELSRITYTSGSPVFFLRDPRRKERREGADFVVVVSTREPTEELLYDGRPGRLKGVVRSISRISGTHSEGTEGIFLAAGPDLDPSASAAGIDIHDIAPTLLYTLGLPVGENFAGRPWTELFRDDFRRTHPVRTIPAWEVPREGSASTSEVDEEIVRELKSLGYL
ncbi:MAG: alkaline phosphatase family protein [Acidobacteria bacterium]|nr:alkaline phosphatase family protein [Acidobacteriota bacterium]